MDFNALQHKLFALDPSDPREDLRKLAESAGQSVEAAPTKDYVVESVQVQEGTMPVEGDYSLSDFAALAGVTLTEAQKTGSAGQAKGRDPMPKAQPGRTKHPLKDKLVGEGDDEKSSFRKGVDWGSKNYNNLNALRGGSEEAQGKDSDTTKSKKSSQVAAKKTTKATNITSWRGFLQQHTAQLQQIASDPKKKKKFDEFMAKIAEDIQEAVKPKPIKARDPNSQYMNDLRKSGAMGAHKDKKRDAKMGKEKHKGKEYTTESIKQMLYRKLNESK